MCPLYIDKPLFFCENNGDGKIFLLHENIICV